MSSPPPENDPHDFLSLYNANLIPLHACLAALTWFVHDYFLTLENEIRHVWPQRASIGKFMFLWIRYYTLALLIFDVVQIHLFAIPGATNESVCIAMDSLIRVVGAVSLWSVELIMQLRIYALYNCSRRVAIINGSLFAASVVSFFGILINNAVHRPNVIASAINLPLPGCPSIHTGIEWAQWVPATVFEVVLFFFALWKTISRILNKHRVEGIRTNSSTASLYSVLLRDNIFYFFGVTFLLVFNLLMVTTVTRIPWFSYAPFHAAVGIIATRLLLHLRMVNVKEEAKTAKFIQFSSNGTTPNFAHAVDEDASPVSPGLDYRFQDDERDVFWGADREKPLPPITFTVSELISISSTDGNVSHASTGYHYHPNRSSQQHQYDV